MKVALVCDWYAPRLGGIETQLADLADALRARGHEAHVITATPGPAQRHVHRLGVPLVPGWNVVRSRRALDALHALFAREAYDVVHAHSLYSPLAHAATYVAKLIGTPSLLTSHSLFDRASALLLRAFVPGWSAWPTRLSAVGALAAAELRWLAGRGDVTLLPNGVDTARFAAPPRRGPRSMITIASVLRLHARKRPLTLVRALPEVLRRAQAHCLDADVRLVLAGDGPLRGAVRAEAARLGVADHLELRGAVPRANIPTLLAAADLFALPSTNEAFGIVALEARAAGLPVVAMRDGGASELIEHGREGLLAEDDDEFAAQLGTLVVDAALRARMQEDAPRQLERYAWPAVAARHEAVYAELAERPAPARVAVARAA
jgi:glycosyltransferase involved in cell wall biosynthesis